MDTGDAVAIIRELAQADIEYCTSGDMFGYATCQFCTPVDGPDGLPTHAQGCLVLRARAFMQWITASEGERP